MKNTLLLNVFAGVLLAVSMASAQNMDSIFVRRNYGKQEYQLPMRDGITLYTIVYTPKDKSRTYPIMMKRTCYSIRPYGEDQYLSLLGPSKYMMRDMYIFVYQDVRGRYMSGGSWTNMTPNIPGNNPRNKKETDESSDTFDTIEWLLGNIGGHNGKVGMWGISYPGFYTAAALPDAHPALVSSSPQAPVSDFFFDDFHHQGLIWRVIRLPIRFSDIRKMNRLLNPGSPIILSEPI